MNKITFEYILFDLIGTTILDTKNGESLILDCFYKSFYENGLEINYYKINQQRGKIKREAIKEILIDSNANLTLTEKVYSDFINLLKESVSYFIEINEASKLFEYLKERHIKIGLGSGLPKEFLLAIINQVGWNIKRFDYIGSSEELGSGRPNPIMVYDSMNKLNIKDKSKVLKIGDTIVDIQEGKNAGVMTASVLTGTQKKDDLTKYYPDYVFEDINELRNII